ncbi:MAG: hypothetical protein ABR574_10805 [Cryomorphaceae bacterium]|nr:DUF1857 family protein [Flavobacteriales bacterium]
MVNVSYHISVSASRQKIWKVYMDKVEHPEKYIGGVGHVEFQELDGGRRLRTMQRNGVDVKEIITPDEERGVTHFELQNHPVYNGFIETGIRELNGELVLDYKLRWEAHTGPEKPEEIEAWFEKAVMDTVKSIQGKHQPASA